MPRYGMRLKSNATREIRKRAGRPSTAWGLLEINIGDPGLRNGLRQGPFGYQYTEEEIALHDKVLKIAKDITGKRGDNNGEISRCSTYSVEPGTVQNQHAKDIFISLAFYPTLPNFL